MRAIDYEAMYKWMYGKRGFVSFAVWFDRAAVIISAVSYIFLLVFSYIGSSVYTSLMYLALGAVPFVCLSVFRRILAAPRPYEIYDFPALGIDAVRSKRGSSFPSRHVFCAFLIGTLLLVEVPVLATIVLLMGVGLGACRVLLGVHFIRDCVAGAISGVVCGVIGLLIMLVF